jgi:2-(1,2-epoxy-1,2-dihydrophenyl)acetyl-CoA isomerase
VVEGAEAAEWNMIHRAVPASDVDATASELVATLAKSATVGLGLAKWLLHVGATAPLDEHLRNEAFAMELSSRSEDFREGLKAFGEKRPPEFGGR